MVVRFCERTNGTAQRNLQMRGLQLRVRKVCSELEIPADVIRIFLKHAPALEFDGHTKQVFAARGNEGAPLGSIISNLEMGTRSNLDLPRLLHCQT